MKDHLIGDTRQALETALQDPFFYLEVTSDVMAIGERGLTIL